MGGGFAIVPALVLLAGLPMHLASGTSLVLIAANSMVALGALGHWPASGLPLLVPLVAGGLVGAIGGQALAPHVSDRHLRQGFAALLIGSALLTSAEAVHRHRASARLDERTSAARTDNPAAGASRGPSSAVNPLQR